MNAREWMVIRGALALVGAVLTGFGASFVAPPAVSVFDIIVGLAMLLVFAPRREWRLLLGHAVLMAGAFGLLWIASEVLRIAPWEPRVRLPGSYSLRCAAYAVAVALGWAERRRNRRMQEI